MEEAQNVRNVYIAYQINGEDLKSKAQGGNGPYQLVILSDPFSQRWCKYVNGVEIE
jgi:spermidine/putrescine-binding protein